MSHSRVTSYQLRTLLAQAKALKLSSRAVERLTWFLYYAEHGHSVTHTCAHFGISRATFQRWLERFDPLDPQSLEERSHHPRTTRKSTVAPEVVELIRGYRMRNTQMGKERIVELLQQEHQITLSASTVGRVIERECLYFDATPLHWKKRMRVHDVHEQQVIAQAIAEAPAPVASASIPQENIVSTKSDAVSTCANCFFCRLKNMQWRPVLRMGVFALSVFTNIAVLLALLAGVFWQREADTTQAQNQAAPALEILHSSDSPDSPLDAR